MRSRASIVVGHGGRALYEAVLVVALPLFLAAWSVRHLLPPALGPAEAGDGGARTAVVRFAAGNPVLVGAALFIAFGWLIRYWSQHLFSARAPVPAVPRAREVRLAAHPRVHAADLAVRAIVARALLREQAREAITFALSVALAAGLALGLRAAAVESYRVVGGSMLPTFESGDCILASKASFGLRLPLTERRVAQRRPRRGELIVFGHDVPGEPEHLIKRVIGLPGDHVGMRRGHPVINGWEIPSCDAGTYFYAFAWGGIHGRLLVEFLEDRAYLTVLTPLIRPFTADYVVKPGEVFVLGDNRNESTDSRAWNDGAGGGVPLSTIDGGVERFLLGTHRDGTVDLARALTRSGTTLHLEGLDAAPLDAGIARCLQTRPKETRPPADPTVPRVALQSTLTP